MAESIHQSNLDKLIVVAKKERSNAENRIAPTVQTCIELCLEYESNFKKIQKYFRKTAYAVRKKIRKLQEDIASRLSDTYFYCDFVSNNLVTYKGVGRNYLHGEIVDSQELHFLFPKEILAFGRKDNRYLVALIYPRDLKTQLEFITTPALLDRCEKNIKKYGTIYDIERPSIVLESSNHYVDVSSLISIDEKYNEICYNELDFDLDTISPKNEKEFIDNYYKNEHNEVKPFDWSRIPESSFKHETYNNPNLRRYLFSLPLEQLYLFIDHIQGRICDLAIIEKKFKQLKVEIYTQSRNKILSQEDFLKNGENYLYEEVSKTMEQILNFS